MNPHNNSELAFLNMLDQVITFGSMVPTRNGERATVFGKCITFPLTDHRGERDALKVLPLMTMRKLPFKMIKTELEWFLTGSTSIKLLQKNNCKFWDAWALSQDKADEFLDAEAKLYHRNRFDSSFVQHADVVNKLVNTVGPMYGYNWRKPLPDGGDQITRLISELKANPYSTQHLLTSYDPAVKMDESMSSADNILSGKGALTPCHGIHTQFVCLPPYRSGKSASDKPRLHCMVTNRSQDLPVGAVMNIAMYGLLTHLIAHVCGFDAEELMWVGAHCHVYPNQIDCVKELVRRRPFEFPDITIDENLTDLLKFTADSVTLNNYQHHDAMVIPVTA